MHVKTLCSETVSCVKKKTKNIFFFIPSVSAQLYDNDYVIVWKTQMIDAPPWM